MAQPRREDMKPSWLELTHVDEREDAATAWIVVTLGCNGQRLAGMSPAVKKRRRRHGIGRAALATLNAIEVFAEHQLVTELVDVACVRVGGQLSVLVRVRLMSEGEANEMFGVARVSAGLAEAAAEAVLDAANLYVGSLLARA